MKITSIKTHKNQAWLKLESQQGEKLGTLHITHPKAVADLKAVHDSGTDIYLIEGIADEVKQLLEDLEKAEKESDGQ